MAKIAINEEGRGIYSINPFVDKNNNSEYDYILLKDFNMIRLSSKEVSYLDVMGNLYNGQITFEVELTDTGEKYINNAEIVAYYNDFRVSNKIDIQTLVDVFTNSVYIDTEIDEDETIMDIKSTLIEEMCMNIFNKVGIILNEININNSALLYCEENVVTVSNSYKK